MAVFDEDYVDCNSCEHYHNNTCDAVPVGSERSCSAYKATRREDIPRKIKSLTDDVRGIKKDVLIIYILILLDAIFGFISSILG